MALSSILFNTKTWGRFGDISAWYATFCFINTHFLFFIPPPPFFVVIVCVFLIEISLLESSYTSFAQRLLRLDWLSIWLLTVWWESWVTFLLYFFFCCWKFPTGPVRWSVGPPFHRLTLDASISSGYLNTEPSLGCLGQTCTRNKTWWKFFFKKICIHTCIYILIRHEVSQSNQMVSDDMVCVTTGSSSSLERTSRPISPCCRFHLINPFMQHGNLHAAPLPYWDPD